eukprot:jgi/Botrbrau1/16296/Bobra.0066s0065.1
MSTSAAVNHRFKSAKICKSNLECRQLHHDLQIWDPVNSGNLVVIMFDTKYMYMHRLILPRGLNRCGFLSSWSVPTNIIRYTNLKNHGLAPGMSVGDYRSALKTSLFHGSGGHKIRNVIDISNFSRITNTPARQPQHSLELLWLEPVAKITEDHHAVIIPASHNHCSWHNKLYRCVHNEDSSSWHTQLCPQPRSPNGCTKSTITASGTTNCVQTENWTNSPQLTNPSPGCGP